MSGKIQSLGGSRQRGSLVASVKTLPDHCGWNDLKSLSSDEIEKSLRIVSTLGHGSMGLVDEVRGPNDEKAPFVRKRVFLPHFKRTQLLRIVREEAKVIEGLTHIHIVHIIDTYDYVPKSGMPSFSLLMFPVGEGDLTQFLHKTSSMEPPLASELHDAAEPETWDKLNSLSKAKSALVLWFSCLMDALVYIHSQGIRHQDIKPSNIVYLRDIYSSPTSAHVVGSIQGLQHPQRIHLGLQPNIALQKY